MSISSSLLEDLVALAGLRAKPGLSVTKKARHLEHDETQTPKVAR